MVFVKKAELAAVIFISPYNWLGERVKIRSDKVAA